MTANYVEAALAALQRLDVEGLVGMYVDGFVFEDAAAGQTITTRNDLAEYFRHLFSTPDVAFTDVASFGCGDGATAEWVWSGTRPDGKPFSVKGVSVFKLAARGIKREAVFYDPRAALE